MVPIGSAWAEVVMKVSSLFVVGPSISLPGKRVVKKSLAEPLEV
jgi:hypothetical protein